MKVVSLLSSLLLMKNAFGSSSTYCDDAYECESTSINTTNAFCWGYYGCDDADITSTYHYNMGALASYDAEIDSYYSWSFGYRSAYYADFSIMTLYAYGYQSALYSDIVPYANTLNLYLYGYYSGYAADVYCYSGDNCKIRCGKSYGCYSLKYYCYSGATCYYDCDEDDVCPTLYSGVSSTMMSEGKAVSTKIFDDLTDEEINAKKEENRKIKMLKIKKEQQSGKMDPELYQGTLRLAKERGELDQIPKEFFNGVSVPHGNDSIFDSIKYSGYEAVIYCLIGALLFVATLKIVNQCKHLMNGKDTFKYVPIV